MDELRDIKRDEIEKKQQQLHTIHKEQSWIAFVSTALENYRMQVGHLSTEFDRTVVGTVNKFEFVFQGSDIATGKDVVSKLLWKECTTGFQKEIHNIIEGIAAEAESLKSVQSCLNEEGAALEKEILERKRETDSMFASGSSDGNGDGNDNHGQSELVDHLSSILMVKPATVSDSAT